MRGKGVLFIIAPFLLTGMESFRARVVSRERFCDVGFDVALGTSL